MRKVFLDELPTKEGWGANKGKKIIDWENSIGFIIPFVYDDIEGELEVCECKILKGRITITVKYNNIIKDISPDNLRKVKIAKCIGKRVTGLKYNIGENIVTKRKDITITNARRIRKEDGNIYKEYMYKCNVCGFDCFDCYIRGEYISEYWVAESSISKENIGCPCCSNRITSPNINSILVTDKWMVDYFVDGLDVAKRYTRGSDKKVKVVCPNCGRQKDEKICIDRLRKEKSIGCICGDGVSYPEKIMISILNQLNIANIYQYSPDYLGRKSSDFYLPNHNLIIEMDGRLGHKGGVTHSKSDKTLEECIEVDEWKDKQHLLHGLETIRIDCFESNMEYIKSNIINSKLNKILDFSNINWLECEKFAIDSNRIKEVCEYWNNKEDWETTTDLAKRINMNRGVVKEYLKRGSKFGWCNYNPEEESSRKSDKNKKKVIVFKDEEKVGEYNSIKDLSKMSVIDFGEMFERNRISMVCNGHISHYKGYIFKFKKEEEKCLDN